MAPMSLPVGETWIHFVVVQHPGLVAFLVMDAIIFLAAASLLTVQASQVSGLTISLFVYLCSLLFANDRLHKYAYFCRAVLI